MIQPSEEPDFEETDTVARAAAADDGLKVALLVATGDEAGEVNLLADGREVAGVGAEDDAGLRGTGNDDDNQ